MQFEEALQILENHFMNYTLRLHTHLSGGTMTSVVKTKNNPSRLAYLALYVDAFDEICGKRVALGYLNHQKIITSDVSY